MILFNVVNLVFSKYSLLNLGFLMMFSSDEVSKLMGKGRRHLVCNEVVQAVKCFEEATQKLYVFNFCI